MHIYSNANTEHNANIEHMNNYAYKNKTKKNRKKGEKIYINK